MPRPTRAALAAVLSLALFAPAAQADPAPQAPPSAEAQQFQWPQSYADLRGDAHIRFGTLPNGMRYAVMHSATPPGQASLRLRFDVGSMMESDSQQGLAHFIEHMAFNGSTHVPEGEMIHMLQRLGLSFGADTNAVTGFDQTVYKLDLPNTRAETVNDSLMILRETAGELTISAGAVDRERGVILSEERQRATPEYRTEIAELGFQLQGQRLASRFPIGQTDVIRHATRDQLAALYRAYYRPERAILVAVGDFDPAVMEAQIRQHFGDWRGVGPAGREPDRGAVAARRETTLVHTEPGAPETLQVAWMSPPDLAADSREHRRRMIVEQLGMAVLNERLAAISSSPEAPWMSASAFRDDIARSARFTALAVNAKPGRWRDALAMIEQEGRRAARYGVMQSELDRVITERRNDLQTAVSQFSTFPTPGLAESIVNETAERRVYTSTEDDLAIFDEAVHGLTAEQVSATLAADFQGAGPLVFVAAPNAIEGGQEAVTTAFNASAATPVTAPTAQARVTWPYGPAAAPGTVAERREIADIGVTFVRFANGVRLTVRPSREHQQQIMVRVRFGSGLLGERGDRPNALWASGAFIQGGLHRLDVDGVQRVMAGHNFGIGLGAEEDAFSLSGTTRAADLDLQLQLMAAYMTDPEWRPQAFEQSRASLLSAQDQMQGSDQGVLAQNLDGLLHRGDARWVFPSNAQITGASVADLRRDIDPALTTGPIEVLVIGDTTVDDAVRSVGATFGGLPPRPPAGARPPEAAHIAFPGAQAAPVVLTHRGRADQAMGLVAWPTNDFFADRQRSRTVTVLAQVLNLRLLEVLREQEGATYTPSADNFASYGFTGYGYLYAAVEMPPERMDGLFADVRRIAADLRDHPPTADELNRARGPLVETLDHSRSTNEFWLERLSGAQDDPRRLESIRSLLDDFRRVTAADVQAAARLYLTDEHMWRLVVRPAAGATTAAAAPAPAAH